MAASSLDVEYAAWAVEWNTSMHALDRSLSVEPQGSRACAEDDQPGHQKSPCARLVSLRGCEAADVRQQCDRSCGLCGRVAGDHTERTCALVAIRHLAKTGGVSVREWMLRLEQQKRGRFFGPVTWMAHRGRCDGRTRFLHCCHPADLRPVSECRQVRVTQARSLAVSELADRSKDAVGMGASWARSSTVEVTEEQRALTLLEFHWPDSAMGRWGEPHTFLQMLPRMRPTGLPGCRVVVTTVLRDPHTLYLSLQRHQYDAMREYGRQALRDRCGCNLTACDVVGFITAFPNFQSWRLTSIRWLVPPLSFVGHRAMYAAASRLLSRLDLVGVTERLDDWLQLVCERAGIRPCGSVGHRNVRHLRKSTQSCAAPDPTAMRVAVRRHARADVWLHADATARFRRVWEQRAPQAS